MRRLIILALLMFYSAATLAAQTIASADNYNAVAYFTSGLVDGEPIDRIDTAYLDQDYIVLYVDWEDMGMRAYRTEVRIVDPKGQLVGKIRVNLLPGSGRYYTYYYYRPSPEARIPVMANE